MKDLPLAINELRQILSQKIIPQVASKESLRMILAQRPLRLPPDVRAKRQSAPALKVDGKLKSSLFLAQNKEEKMHAIRVPYLCYVMEGEIEMRLGIPAQQGKSRGAVNSYEVITLPAKNFLFLPPGVFFPARGPHTDSRVFWLHIFPTGARCHTSTTRKGIYTSDNYDIFVPDTQLTTLTEILCDELQSSDTNNTLSAQSALLLLILRVQRGLSISALTSKGPARESQSKKKLLGKSVSDVTTPIIHSTILDRACNYIQRQRGLPLDIGDIANHAFVSPSHLAKLFRIELKTTVKKYVLEQRMEAARSMLTNTEISIQEIARFTGYMQSPQFTRVFKQVHHVTPLEFRRKHQYRGN